jgi:branched-chain amino acid transport system substrate-binding protein
MQGSSTAQIIPMVNGIRLALSQAHCKAGRYIVKDVAPDDSTRGGGQVEPAQTAPNDHQATADPKAVYYIGEFNSGASEVSIPILDAAGLAPVPPANTAPPTGWVNFCKFQEQSCFAALATSINALLHH